MHFKELMEWRLTLEMVSNTLYGSDFFMKHYFLNTSLDFFLLSPEEPIGDFSIKRGLRIGSLAETLFTHIDEKLSNGEP